MVVLSEVPEGSSSSSPSHVHSSSTGGQSSSTHGPRYDVFLSFRGFDTRYSFTDHLYNALINAHITTFLDDKDMETGEDLTPELENAIKSSQASIIVLSKNYATSTWCLDELVLILEQHKTSNHIVIPIFYHVEPSHVRWQEGSFEDAMAKHKQTMKEETYANKKSQWAQKIDRWTKALTKVADLKGNDVKGRLETEFIEDIVKDIHRRLRVLVSSAQSLLFGVDRDLNFVTSWLKDGTSHKADILTILGTGGIGKTSLAKHVYSLHCREFPLSSCLEDISRRCENFNGLLNVQKQLCHDISKTSSIQVHDVSMYTSKIENALAHKKVFLVLDDVDTIDQLDALLGSKSFHPGSKIIITTKNAWLTKSCALFKTNINPKHVEVLLEGLHEIESLQLLCLHAFTYNYPKAGYEEVSNKLLEYCQGHPLALKVLGESLYNKDVADWEGCIEVLKKETNPHINKILRMSFDSLPYENDQKLLKYISCYFVGKDKDVTETILDACDINIGQNNELKMHQLVQEMGRFEVSQESQDKPWKRSCLWSNKESLIALKRKKAIAHGKAKVKGLALDMRMREKEKLGALFELETDALSNMDSLVLLQLNYVHMIGSYENFPGELRSLCMHGSPLKSIPSHLRMENLVALDMSYSNIESFPKPPANRQKPDASCLKAKQLFPSLKILNLSFCKKLCSIGDFDQLPTLERLIVRNSISLVEVGESIEHCFELALIDLSYCKNLKKPLNIGMLKKVKTVLLDGCNLGEFRIKITDFGKANKNNNFVSRLWNWARLTSSSSPRDLKLFAISLPRSLVTLSLANNSLYTKSFPIDFSCLSMLKELYLDGNPMESLPSCVRTLPRIEILSLEDCDKMKSVEHPPRTLRKLMLFSRRRSFIEKFVFDSKISPLRLYSFVRGFAPGLYEIEGMVKIQPMVNVEEKILRSLGWTYIDFLNESPMGTNSSESQIQMYYEFGIFSTMYEHEEMPSWFGHRSVGPSISFTIPSSPKKLRGLNFCFVHTSQCPDDPVLRSQYLGETFRHPDIRFPFRPMITVSNVTKNQMWIYERYLDRSVPNDWVLLSHWMFEMNEMEAGDYVTIDVTLPYDEPTNECGVRLVYEEEEEEEEEDALGYYKSWNHIIGGDLSHFQTATGEYVLYYEGFSQSGLALFPYHQCFKTRIFDRPGLANEPRANRSDRRVGRVNEYLEAVRLAALSNQKIDCRKQEKNVESVRSLVKPEN
ncbi:hypothetical protein LXL04_009735 [Taraxacum kok-saghyz]